MRTLVVVAALVALVWLMPTTPVAAEEESDSDAETVVATEEESDSDDEAVTALDTVAVTVAVTVAGAVTGLDVDIMNATSLRVKWLPAADEDSPVTGYDIQRSEDGGEAWADIAAGNRFWSHRDQSLTTGQPYWYRVRVVREEGPGPWSEPVSATPAAPPDVIADLAVGTIGASSLTLTWSVPPENGSPIFRYELQRMFGSDHRITVDLWAFSEWPDELTTFSFEVKNALTVPGRAYRVRSWNAAGPSEWSEPLVATGAGVPERTPTLTIIGIDPRAVRLRWTAPDGNGSDIFTYQIARRAGLDHLLDFDHWARVAWADKTYTTIEASFSTFARTFRVRAWNAVGEGAWSPRAAIRWGLMSIGGTTDEFRAILGAQCPGGVELYGSVIVDGDGRLVPFAVDADGQVGEESAAFEEAFAEGFEVTPVFVTQCQEITYLDAAVTSSSLMLTTFKGGVDRLQHALETECDAGVVAYANAPDDATEPLVAYSPSWDDAENAAFIDAFPFRRFWHEPLLISGCAP